MSLKHLFGLDKENISEAEIERLIEKARQDNKEFIVIKGIRINIEKEDDSNKLECGILD
jgi:hypothetical protein